MTIFDVAAYQFPYTYHFTGQAADEVILYLTREDVVLLQVRRAAVLGVAAIILLGGMLLLQVIGSEGAGVLGQVSIGPLFLIFVILAGLFAGIGWWWVTVLWRQSVAILTTKRLVKFVATSPWNHHTLSLPLEMIVDLGSYSKGIFQAWLKLGTFTARSSASSSGVATDDPSRINKKYFYIDNVQYAEDLQNYVQKVLFVFRQDWQKLTTLRPFIPALHGKEREAVIAQYPQYWS